LKLEVSTLGGSKAGLGAQLAYFRVLEGHGCQPYGGWQLASALRLFSIQRFRRDWQSA
jgi:hypothetical protein